MLASVRRNASASTSGSSLMRFNAISTWLVRLSGNDLLLSADRCGMARDDRCILGSCSVNNASSTRVKSTDGPMPGAVHTVSSTERKGCQWIWRRRSPGGVAMLPVGALVIGPGGGGTGDLAKPGLGTISLQAFLSILLGGGPGGGGGARILTGGPLTGGGGGGGRGGGLGGHLATPSTGLPKDWPA